MNNTPIRIRCIAWLGSMLLLAGTTVAATPVNPLNFVRAATDKRLGDYVAEHGLGVIRHRRAVAHTEEQDILPDTVWSVLYSTAVFDLAHPVEIRLPEIGDRPQSLLVLNQDQYVKLVAYTPGTYTVDRKMSGTRYALVVVRTLVNADSLDDLSAARAAQDKVKISQAERGSFSVPDWRENDLEKIRDIVSQLAFYKVMHSEMFGAQDRVDPIKHLLSAAIGWAGTPPESGIDIPLFADQPTPGK